MTARRLLFTLLLAGAVLAGLRPAGFSRTVQADSSVQTSVGVMAYFTPGQEWTEVMAAAPAVRYAVMNPASGPGAAARDHPQPGRVHGQVRGVADLLHGVENMQHSPLIQVKALTDRSEL